MAEEEGFEPPIPFQVRQFSRLEPSTTRPLFLSEVYYATGTNAKDHDLTGKLSRQTSIWGLRSWDDPDLSIRLPRRPMTTSIVDGGYFIPKS